MVLLAGTIAFVVTAFIKARKTNQPAGVVREKPVLPGTVTTVIEGYKRVETDKDGREKFRLLAAKDTGFDDGRHELEKVDLTAFGQNGKSMRITSDRASLLRDQSQVTFEGNVKITSSDGMEVTTEAVAYDQVSEIASTDKAVQFRQAGSHSTVSGSSTGANLNSKAHTLALPKDARILSATADPKNKNSLPVEIRGERANYAELDGVARFEGNVSVVQGERSGYADTITGVVNVKTKKLERIEMRGNSILKSLEKGRASEMRARDIDFYFDELQQLKAASANGAARAISLEKDSPREIVAETMNAAFKPNEKGSDLQSVTTGGRTTMKIEVTEGTNNTTERVIEADAVQAVFHDDGKNLQRAEANGNAVLTVTPKQIAPKSERQRLRSPKFIAEFFETGNAVKSFVSDGNSIAEFEPMMPQGKDGKLLKKTLSGRKMTSNFEQQKQEIADLTVDGDAKFTEGDRNATAARGLYTASNRNVAMRGKPQLWDSSSRANAEEIDANLDTGESELRGRVRTTYFSRETTGGGAPFKNRKAPVTIASDRALVRHNEGAARYLGNVRAWQDDDFVRAENMELDKGERMMTAWGNAQSAFYDFEREVEKNKKEIVPVFASADRIVYTDSNHTAHYEGGVKIKQGPDRIDAAVADVVMNEENKLVRMTASKQVVMTQPGRRATGDDVVYTAENDTAILTGNPAQMEDNEHAGVTKSPKLTLHLRDARIEANDVSDAGDVKNNAKRRVKTTHRIQN